MKSRKYKTKKGDKFTVRPAQKTDAAGMLEYVKEVFNDDRFFVSTLADMKDELTLDKTRQWIAKHRDNPHWNLLLADYAGKIVGETALKNVKRLRTQHVGTLGITVLQGFRGIGIGTALLENMLDWGAKNAVIEKIGLSAFATNKRAFGLYRKMGFVEEGRRVKEYKIAPGEYVDSILMYKFVK